VIPDEAQWAAHRQAALHRAIEALPAPQKRALSLAFFDELTHEQVASVLRTPVGTAKTRIRLAMTRLAPLLVTLLAAVAAVLAVRSRRRLPSGDEVERAAVHPVERAVVEALHDPVARP
jgi:RNA polymerase sigma-70 factor (ECF subfamily)